MAIGSLIALAPLCSAETGKHFSAFAGLGAIVAPEYRGSDEYETAPVPFIAAYFSLGDVLFFATPQEGAGAKLSFPASGIFLKGFASFESLLEADNPAFRQDTSRFVNGNFEFGWANDDYRITVKYVYAPAVRTGSDEEDIRFDGSLIIAALGGDIDIGAKLKLASGISVQMMNDDFADASFSAESRSTKSSGFDPGPGISEIKISSDLRYAYDKRVAFIAFGQAAHLLGDARTSPIVESPLNIRIGFLTVYRI